MNLSAVIVVLILGIGQGVHVRIAHRVFPDQVVNAADGLLVLFDPLDLVIGIEAIGVEVGGPEVAGLKLRQVADLALHVHLGGGAVGQSSTYRY